MKTGDLLLIVDPQIDFMPQGALPVPQGDEIIPIVNAWIKAAEKIGIPIAISRDWHPPNHISFKERGGPWPVHCVRETPGAAFHPDLAIPQDAIVIDKAIDPDYEAYSAFQGITHDTHIPVPELLRQLGIRRIWIAGLALDYCVYHSAITAHELGYEFHVILPACRAISQENSPKIIKQLKELGSVLETDSRP
jgi:nicotinamidase/pyrazinamidase